MSTEGPDTDGLRGESPRPPRDADRLRARIGPDGNGDDTDADRRDPDAPVPPMRMRDEARLRNLMSASAGTSRTSRDEIPLPDSRPAASEPPASRQPFRQPSYMTEDADGEGVSFGRRLAVPAAILGGVVVALVAYAGGSDFLEMVGIGGRTHTLGNYAQGIAGIGKDSSDGDSLGAIPRALRHENLKPDTAKKVARVEARVDSTRIPDPSDTATVLEDNVPARTPKADQAGGVESSQPSEKPAGPTAPQAKPEEGTAAAAAPTATQPPAKRYSIQVGATPDRAEAEKLARRLKARGVSGVSITEIRKDGASVYRVRYGAFGTEAEARASASRNGLGEYWVVGR